MNNRKKLEWQFSLGTAAVVFHVIPGKDVELSCSTVQMMLLMALNDLAAPEDGGVVAAGATGSGSGGVPVSALAEAAGLPVDKAKMALAPLTCDRNIKPVTAQVLTVVGATKLKPAGESDFVKPNPEFHKIMKNVRIIYL